jgi:hypothetical protein
MVKQISTQFNSQSKRNWETTVNTEGPMCKAQDSNHMSQATYKTKRLDNDIQTSLIKRN